MWWDVLACGGECVDLRRIRVLPQDRDPGLIDATRTSFNAVLNLLNTQSVSPLAEQERLMWEKYFNAMPATFHVQAGPSQSSARLLCTW